MVALMLVVLGPFLANSVSAYDEADAGLLLPQVANVWHAPNIVPPHTQWRGFLQVRPGNATTEIVAASYQICQVGKECFAPPHAAQRLDATTFTFNTTSYLANGAPVDYQAGWRIGVKWVLTDAANVSYELPRGLPQTDPACSTGSPACAESHYLAFDMPPAPPKATPGFALQPLIFVSLIAAGLLRRSRSG